MVSPSFCLMLRLHHRPAVLVARWGMRSAIMATPVLPVAGWVLHWMSTATFPTRPKAGLTVRVDGQIVSPFAVPVMAHRDTAILHHSKYLEILIKGHRQPVRVIVIV